MPVRPGEVYWVLLEGRSYPHPHVVIQNPPSTQSHANTVMICALTTNLKRAKSPGHVLLEAGEANLPKQSVVVVSQVSIIDQTQLGEYIGSLRKPRMDQIVAGMRFLERMTAHHRSAKIE